MSKKKLVTSAKQTTATFRFTLGIGFANAEHEEEVELEDLPVDPEEREKVIEDAWKEWAWQYIDGGPTEL